MDLLTEVELDQEWLDVRIVAGRQTFDIESPHPFDGSVEVRLTDSSPDMTSSDPPPPADKCYLDTPYVSVRWVSEGRWVLVEWKAWANSSEYRAAHESVLLALRENHASRNLIDATEAKVVSDDDQKWLIENWIPRATAAGRRFTAVVLPRRPLARTISENIDKRPRLNPTKVQYFPTVKEAAAWLSTVN
jgi:hypothetical protein